MNRLLEEAKELEKIWLMKKEFIGVRATTAVLLESQRLFNEMPRTGNHWLDKVNYDNYVKDFRSKRYDV